MKALWNIPSLLSLLLSAFPLPPFAACSWVTALPASAIASLSSRVKGAVRSFAGLPLFLVRGGLVCFLGSVLAFLERLPLLCAGLGLLLSSEACSESLTVLALAGAEPVRPRPWPGLDPAGLLEAGVTNGAYGGVLTGHRLLQSSCELLRRQLAQDR